MKTKFFTLLLNKSLLSKLALIVLLLTGGGNCAWGDTWSIIFTGNQVPTGWECQNHTIFNEELSPSSTYGVSLLASQSTCNLTSGQRIVIKAKSDGNASAYIYFYKSASKVSTSSPTSPTTKFEFKYYEKSKDYIEIVIDNLTTENKYLGFKGYHATIQSVELVDNYNQVLDEDKSIFYTTSTPKDLTIKYTAQKGWNTIVLPIPLSTYSSDFFKTIFGEDYSAYEFTGYSSGVLSFTKIIYSSKKIGANIPCLVYINNSPDYSGGYPQISINNFSYHENHNVSAGGATFQGTYVTKEYQEGDDWYGVTTAGQVMKAGTGAKVKGYRAYFTGISAPAAGAHISIAIDDDGGTTDLGFVKLIDENANDVYTLSGQKVKKGGKGIYIVNGRKVIIK